MILLVPRTILKEKITEKEDLAQRNLRWTRSFFVLKSYSCSVATFSEMIWIKPIDEKLCYIYNTVVKRIT